MPFKLVARNRDQTFSTTVNVAGPTLLDILQAQQIPIKSSCMGKGICRQCRVQIEKSLAPVQAADRKSFSEAQLQSGWRLSCCIRPKANLEVFFPQTYVFQDSVQKLREPVSDWWYACDLGTTGIEIAAVDRQGSWALAKALNKQVVNGADVMTRLEYAQRNGVKPLYDRMEKQLLDLLTKIEALTAQKSTDARTIYLAGNSAVTAFAAQMSIDELAVAPYQPVSLEAQKFTLGDGRLTAHTLPLLYSFVGGDLWAGLFQLWKENKFLSRPWILMDVGTNSEILFWDGETLFVSSTPAGPAFEGSSISIGMRAEPGAVLNPRYSTAITTHGSHWNFATVADDVPKGICGSALIQFIAEAVRAGVISVDGEVLDAEKLKLTPDLAISQDDVREFQLAKSAIQTGLQLVQQEGKNKPEKLYLAGSFGENLPLAESQSVKLLPEAWPVETLGNSSLAGTILWGTATEAEKQEFTRLVQSKMRPIELALRDEFQSAFVQNMNLG